MVFVVLEPLLAEVVASAAACPDGLSLREPSGHDELAVRPGPVGATELIARLLVSGGGAAPRGPELAWRLPTAVRDRVAAALYTLWFGDAVTSNVGCVSCGRAFEMRFSLAALLEHTAASRPEGVTGPDADGRFRAGGVSFRLPTTDDERRAAALPPDEATRWLARRCFAEGPEGRAPQAHDPAPSAPDAERALASIGPLLDLEVPATCAECGASNEVRFDMASFLMEAMVRERRLVLREVHVLAGAYGWSLREILDMPRTLRRDLVSVVVSERAPAQSEVFA